MPFGRSVPIREPDETQVVIPAPAAPPPVVPPAPAPQAHAPAQAAPQAPPAVAAPTAAPSSPKPAKTLQELLNEKGPDEAQKRITRAARKALKAFGIEIPKDADINAAAEAYKAERSAKKAERRDLRTKAEEAESYRGVVESYAKSELASLTDQQRAFVIGVAPSDARAQLAHIQMLRQSGAITAAPAASAAPAVAPVVVPATPAVAAPLPAPAQSAPTQPGPVQTPVAITDHHAEWNRLRNSKDPRDEASASLYFLQHSYEIQSSMARRTA